MMKNYLFAYDTSATIGWNERIPAFIANNKHVLSWSLLFNGAFFLKSESSYEELFQSIKEFFVGVRFVVSAIEITADKTNGGLSNEIWHWLSGLDQDEFSKLLNAPQVSTY